MHYTPVGCGEVAKVLLVVFLASYLAERHQAHRRVDQVGHDGLEVERRRRPLRGAATPLVIESDTKESGVE